ncbi:hypothetical protein FR483_n349R [Paramecium bursaria Chlorella virus FR483]|uniref:Uncharacterized protein n349R n=1 Tax=Paramecium bursaria Chlorella virus FR483 TaxID=399781 RepID=A7J753_PBCVF|nr:hypothetical protein FR483_n349R [Paramecium bursaria Chlorella virus FR483]ABT15634.1 hypothetical protein FR483_n349R [Paramecium bursaria Chlorella virus FR483]
MSFDPGMVISTRQSIKGAFCSQRTSPHHQPSAHKNKQTKTPETPKANTSPKNLRKNKTPTSEWQSSPLRPSSPPTSSSLP